MNSRRKFIIALYYAWYLILLCYAFCSPVAESEMSRTRNPICSGLTERVTQLFQYGINTIWMKASGDERYHIANVLGISIDEWEEAKPISGLFYIYGSINT